MLEAGFGEGYGADLLAGVARRVIGVDYDESAVAHVRARYPKVQAHHGNLAELPLADASVDVVVNFRSSNICGISHNSWPNACACCGRAGHC